jgi:hypothetical protein
MMCTFVTNNYVNFKRRANYSVVLGTLNRDDFEDNRVQFDVPNKFIIVHEGWNKKDNDIALIKLPVGLNLPETSNCKIVLQPTSYINCSHFIQSTSGLFVCQKMTKLLTLVNQE